MKLHMVSISRLVLILMVTAILLLMLVVWTISRNREVHLKMNTSADMNRMMPTITAITQGSLEQGNTVELLQNGDQFFPALMRDIAAARSSVHFESYIWGKGKICDQLAVLLAGKARQGLEVRVLVDASGGSKMTSEIKEMFKQSGVELGAFHPPRISNVGRMNNRDHRKIMVIDGRIGYVGGFGISDNWTGHGEDKDHWRDTGIRITGPVVTHLQGAFTENWIEETGQIPAGPLYFPPLTATGSIPVHVAYTSPTGSATSVQLLHYLTLASARKSITIQNPYLLPDNDTLDIFEAAVKRGVEIRIMSPAASATDSAIVQHASHYRYGELLERGVKLWEYQPTLLHQKVVTIDGIWSGIGSTNFDARSFQLNDEISVGVLDAGIAAGLERAFMEDQKHAKPQTMEGWEKRSLWHKSIDGLAYLLHEQL